MSEPILQKILQSETYVQGKEFTTESLSHETGLNVSSVRKHIYILAEDGQLCYRSAGEVCTPNKRIYSRKPGFKWLRHNWGRTRPVSMNGPSPEWERPIPTSEQALHRALDFSMPQVSMPIPSPTEWAINNKRKRYTSN